MIDNDLPPVRRPPTFAPHILGPPLPYRAVAPPQHQAALLHTSPPAPTSVGTAAVMIPTQQDVRRRVVLPADTPAITSPNHKYNKNNHHMRQQLGQVMVDVMHNASVGRRQRTGRSVMLNRQFGDAAHRTTIVTTV